MVRNLPAIRCSNILPAKARGFSTTPGRGYEAGAVDFLHKPLEPHVLRSKADVFFELDRQRREVARQRDELRAATAGNLKLLKESRRYAAAHEEDDRRKDEFLAMLAHELRNPPMARSEGALGIGPTLVRRPVELHGGRVVAESEGRGRGNTFTVRIPLAGAVPAARTGEGGEARGEAAGTARRRVLVVDDNVDTVLGLSRLLHL